MNRKSPFSKLSLRIMGEKSDHLNLARGRLVLITVFFMLCYLAVGARLIDASIIQGYLSQQPDAIGANEEINGSVNIGKYQVLLLGNR